MFHAKENQRPSSQIRKSHALAKESASITKRLIVFIYGVLAYFVFLLGFLYLIGFLSNCYVPKSVDEPSTKMSPILAAIIDLTLVCIFGAQHSIMARPRFKKWWTQYIPRAAERSTYVVMTNIALALFFWAWQPIPKAIWKTEPGTMTYYMLTILTFGGFGLVGYVTAIFSHFDFFGLRQVWLFMRGKTYEPLPFSVASLYKYVRHPLYVGWIIAFWAVPGMSIGRALLVSFLTIYMVAATFLFEEPDLIHHFEGQYISYKKNVPAFFPSINL